MRGAGVKAAGAGPSRAALALVALLFLLHRTQCHCLSQQVCHSCQWCGIIVLAE